jgi:hypothetical protein
MAGKKKSSGKESKAPRPAPRPRLKKAVPPPDNPMARHQADEPTLEGGDTTQKEMARLRAKAWEQTRQTANPDSDETIKET